MVCQQIQNILEVFLVSLRGIFLPAIIQYHDLKYMSTILVVLGYRKLNDLRLKIQY